MCKWSRWQDWHGLPKILTLAQLNSYNHDEKQVFGIPRYLTFLFSLLQVSIFEIKNWLSSSLEIAISLFFGQWSWPTTLPPPPTPKKDWQAHNFGESSSEIFRPLTLVRLLLIVMLEGFQQIFCQGSVACSLKASDRAIWNSLDIFFCKFWKFYLPF